MKDILETLGYRSRFYLTKRGPSFVVFGVSSLAQLILILSVAFGGGTEYQGLYTIRQTQDRVMKSSFITMVMIVSGLWTVGAFGKQDRIDPTK